MHYRLYLLDSEAKIASLLQLACKDDKRAIAYITDIETKYGMELWHDQRLVRRLEPWPVVPYSFPRSVPWRR